MSWQKFIAPEDGTYVFDVEGTREVIGLFQRNKIFHAFSSAANPIVRYQHSMPLKAFDEVEILCLSFSVWQAEKPRTFFRFTANTENEKEIDKLQFAMDAFGMSEEEIKSLVAGSVQLRRD